MTQTYPDNSNCEVLKNKKVKDFQRTFLYSAPKIVYCHSFLKQTPLNYEYDA